MQPYQKATQAIQRQSQVPLNVASTALGGIAGVGKTALGVGLGLASSKLLGKVAPFLNNFVPANLAVQGISKLNPTLGKFVKDALKQGYGEDEIRDFIGDKVSGEQSKSTSETSQNPVEKLYPALHQFIQQEVGKGRKPQEALGVAKVQGFGKEVEDVAKKLGGNLFQIIDQIYGGQAASSAPQSQAALQPQNQQAQTGQGQQALMAILQKIQQARGG